MRQMHSPLEPLSWAQAVGYFALALSLGAFAMKDDGKLKRTATVGSVVWAAHYFLLGSMTSAVTNLTISVRQAMAVYAHRYSRRTLRILTGFWFAVFTAVLVGTWKDASSLFPYAAAMNATVAWFYHRGTKLRGLLLLSDVFWLLNGVWWHSQ